MPSSKHCIVLARVVAVEEPYRDKSGTVKTREVRQAEAVVWLTEGTADDIVNARNYRLEQHWQVFAYPTTEPDPLGRARKEVMGPCKHWYEHEGSLVLDLCDVLWCYVWRDDKEQFHSATIESTEGVRASMLEAFDSAAAAQEWAESKARELLTRALATLGEV